MKTKSQGLELRSTENNENKSSGQTKIFMHVVITSHLVSSFFTLQSSYLEFWLSNVNCKKLVVNRAKNGCNQIENKHNKNGVKKWPL